MSLEPPAPRGPDMARTLRKRPRPRELGLRVRWPATRLAMPGNAPLRCLPRPHACSLERLCKPEVTGSIPVRSIAISRAVTGA
jgi:hypothetical protein